MAMELRMCPVLKLMFYASLILWKHHINLLLQTYKELKLMYSSEKKIAWMKNLPG